MQPSVETKLPLCISRVALGLGITALLFWMPLHSSLRIYTVLSAAGLIPLFLGPRLYRWFGGAFLIAILLLAVDQHQAALQERAEMARLRAEAAAQFQ